MSSINRILRNRAAERAAVEYTKIASRSLLHMYPPYWTVPTSRVDACAVQDADSSATDEEQRGEKAHSCSDEDNQPLSGKIFFLLSNALTNELIYF